MWQRLSISFLLLGFLMQPLAMHVSRETRKFFLKSSTDPHIGNYYPLRISLELDESFFQNPQLNKTVKATADVTIKILSDLVLSKPSKAGFKFGEEIYCDDFLLHQIIKIQGIDADFGLFITPSYDNNDELIRIKKCENGSQIFVASIEINSKKFLALDDISQVKKLSSAIAGIIFEDNLDKNQLLSEIDDYLEHFPKSLTLGCNPQISYCAICNPQTPSICANCYANYFPSEEGTQCCAGHYCKTCNGPYSTCDSCIDNYILVNEQCWPCPTGCIECNTTACVKCGPGGFTDNGLICMSCPSGCESCYTNRDNYIICSQCFDPTHSKLSKGECNCIKANEDYNDQNICACAPGYYEDTNEICQPCNIGCENCTSPSQCTSCFDQNLTIANGDGSCSCKSNELTYNTTTNTCECPKAEFLDTKTGLCSPCNDLCAWCFAFDDCVECVNNQALRWTDDGSCACPDDSKVYNSSTGTCVPCPEGKYAFEGSCYPCQSICAACSGYNNCTECFPGMHLILSNTTCGCDADPAVFNPSTNSCDPCPNDNCTCPDPTQIYDSNANTCVSCPNGKYASHNECYQCPHSCDLCTSSDICTKCWDGMHLTANSSCECNDPKQVFDPNMGSCINTTCPDPYVFSFTSYSCVLCPDGEFGSDGICQQCQPTCYTCSDADYCTWCYNGLSLTINNTCECWNPLQWFNATSKTCQTCNAEGYCNCGNTMVWDPATKDCVFCPNGEYALDNKCYQCDPTCIACEYSSESCTKCYPGLNQIANNSCVCPDTEQTFNPASKTCENCPNRNCTCPDPSEVFNPTTQSCAPCPNGEFAKTGVCYSCPSTCYECSNSDGCTKCHLGMHLLSNLTCQCDDPSKAFNSTTQTCEDCPTGEYPNNGVCYQCSMNCISCSDLSNCTACWPGEHLIFIPNGVCTCDDPRKTFNVTTNTCECPFGICECPNPQTVYDPKNNSCVNCPNGLFASHGECYSCDSTCFACSSSAGCTDCYQGMHLSSNLTCECNNPDEKFNPISQTCENCDSKKGGCGNDCPDECNVCVTFQVCQTCYDPENMVIQNGVCMCKNPNQAFSISEKKCVDSSSAKGLALVWIFALYAVI